MEGMVTDMKAKPTKKQLEFMSWEMGVFFHFGIRTFFEGHRDWDGKGMDLSGFRPANLDCRQWIRTAKEAGAKYTVMTTKHHDGFANWPTKFSEYSVAHTPWKDGKGDVVQEYVDACREYGMKVGLYYSPAEPSLKEKTAEEYDNYFIEQVSELLSGYGKIDYLWFDGNGSQGHQYDTKRIVERIRSLQPDILLFAMWDPDTRWIGNESGYAPVVNFNTETLIDHTADSNRESWFHVPEFVPAECDCMMRFRNWFYSDDDEDTVKGLDELMGIYCGSVGRGANLLINIGPNREGVLPEKDAGRLLEFGAEIRRRFGNPIAAVESPEPDESGRYVLKFEQPTLINCVVLEEDLAKGEAVTGYDILVQTTHGATPVLFERGESIGHKRICQIPTVATHGLALRITNSLGEVKIKAVKAYYN